MPNVDDEQQEVELALVVVALADVVDREQDRDVGRDEEEALERERVVVDDVRAAEHRPVVAARRERDRPGSSAASTPTDAMRDDCHAVAVGHDEVGDQHDHDRRDEDELGRERVPVEDRRAEAAAAASAASTSAVSGHAIAVAMAFGHARDGRVGDVEDDVREDAERDDEQRGSGSTPSTRSVETSWMCASANSAFGSPNATFCSIQSR